MRTDFLILLLIAALMTSTSLLAATKDADETATVANTSHGEACIKETQWWLPGERKTVAKTELLNNIAGRSTILLGEHHSNEHHHRWHLETIRSLHQIRKNIVLGFETFPRRLQPVLDQWTKGELSKSQFKRKLDWDSFWSFDIDLYMPLFEYARDNRIPMVALNVDRSLMNNVRKHGWKAIPENQKEGLSDPAQPSKDYLRILAASYLQHNPVDPENENERKLDGEKFYLFVQGQLLWDRAMAEGVASVASQSDAPLVIGIMGSWHIINRLGVPHQLSSLGIDDAVVLVPWDTHFTCSEITSAFADAIYGAPIN